jgi:hypothetical protein
MRDTYTCFQLPFAHLPSNATKLFTRYLPDCSFDSWACIRRSHLCNQQCLANGGRERTKIRLASNQFNQLDVTHALLQQPDEARAMTSLGRVLTDSWRMNAQIHAQTPSRPQLSVVETGAVMNSKSHEDLLARPSHLMGF